MPANNSGRVFGQDGGEEDEVLHRALPKLARQLEHPRQNSRRLNDGGTRSAAEGIAPLQLHGEIQALVEHAREGVHRIQADGREHGHHFVEEVLADPGALRFVEIVAAQETHAGFRQLGQDMFVEQPVLALHQLVCDTLDPAKTLPVGASSCLQGERGIVSADRRLQWFRARLEGIRPIPVEKQARQAFDNGGMSASSACVLARQLNSGCRFPVEARPVSGGAALKVFFGEHQVSARSAQCSGNDCAPCKICAKQRGSIGPRDLDIRCICATGCAALKVILPCNTRDS